MSKAGVLLSIGFLFLLIALLSSKARNRLILLGAKLNGRLALSWSDLAVFMVVSSDRWAGRLVRAVSSGPGECGTVYETPLGRFCGGKDDLESLSPAIGEELFSPYERGSVRIRPGDVVLDLGAHLGTFVRVALSRRAGMVVAFEAEPHNSACLERTFADEIAAGRVRIVKAAVWDRMTTLHFAGRRLTGHVDDNGIAVRTVTIDDTVDSLKLERVDFIKSDIEGAERNALSGAAKTLARFHPRMAISIYHLPDDPVVIPRIVSQYHAYNVFTIRGKTEDSHRAFFF